jgi:hypothetical protein
MTMLQNIDGAKAIRSYKCCVDHPQARALHALQRRLLKATDAYISAKSLGDRDGVNVLALRHLSRIYALTELKRDLRASY